MMFAYRLARVLGVWDVEVLLDEMPAKVFNGWRAAYQVDPWGGERGDLQAAYVGACSLAPWTKTPTPPHARQFLPSFAAAARPRQSLAEQKTIFAKGKAAFERAQAQRRR